MKLKNFLQAYKKWLKQKIHLYKKQYFVTLFITLSSLRT